MNLFHNFVFNKKRFFYFVILLIITVFFYFGSHLNPLSVLPPTTDEGVWLYIANGILHGQIPYLDMFDHKGPLLYLIYTLGLVIGGENYFGVWLLCLISIIVSLYFNYKLSFLITNSDRVSFISTLLLTLLLGEFAYKAGLKEMFALPFIFISLYLFAKYLCFKLEHPIISSIIIGICGGCVLLITPTLAVLWAIIIPWILINAYCKKSLLCSIKLFGGILVGLIIAILPQIMWLSLNGAFDAFIDCYITYNLSYTATDGPGVIISDFKLLELIICNPGFVFAEIVLLFHLIKPDSEISTKKLCIFSIVFYLITIAITCIIGHGYAHYMIVAFPCLSVPIAWGMQCFDRKIENLKLPHNWNKMFILLLCVCIIGVGGLGNGIYNFAQTNLGLGFKEAVDDNELISYIENTTNKSDNIQIIAYKDTIYLKTDRFAASRFSYFPPGYEIYNEEILNDVKNNEPVIIAIDKARGLKKTSPNLYKYIYDNYYLVKDGDKYTVFSILKG